MKVIGHVRTDFSSKFGIPRQSGLVEQLEGRIIFESEYRNPEAVRGLEEFSHIWLLWQFSLSQKEHWSATVKPPRLGGKKRVGVFATRSPFRPNAIGLSCVRLLRIESDEKLGPVLVIGGADLLDGTPLYDIKPYIPYADCHPDASEGYTAQTPCPWTAGGVPAGISHAVSAGKTGSGAGDSGPGSPARLCAGPAADVRHVLCRTGREIPGGRGCADGVRGGEDGIKTVMPGFPPPSPQFPGNPGSGPSAWE